MPELFQGAIEDGTGSVEGRVVSVAPTATTLVDAFAVRGMTRAVFTLANDDATQTLNAWLEVGPTSSGPWDATEWTGLDDIAALDSRTEAADVAGHSYMRVRATSSGAGLDCRVWASALRTLTRAVVR